MSSLSWNMGRKTLARWEGDSRAIQFYSQDTFCLLFYTFDLFIISLLCSGFLKFLYFTSFRDEVISLLDSIDTRVEALRKEAMKLQEQRDLLQTRIDMLKNTEVLSNLNEDDKEEISLQLKRINERLQVKVNRLREFIDFIYSLTDRGYFCRYRSR